MNPRDRRERRASLNVLRAVLHAIALLAAVLFVLAPSSSTPVRGHSTTGSSPVVAHDLASAHADVDGLQASQMPPEAPEAPPETYSEQEFKDGDHLVGKAPHRQTFADDLDATAVTLTPVDERPVPPRRLLALPSRAPPLA